MDRIFMIMTSSFINIFISLYICGEILSLKGVFKKWNNLLLVLLISIIIGCIYLTTNSFIKVIFNFIVIALTCKKLFKIDVSKSFALSFVALIVSLISEIIYTISLITVLNVDVKTLRLDFFGTVMTNLFIAVIELIIIKINVVLNYLSKFINKINTPKYKMVTILSVLSLTCVAMLTYYIYFQISETYGFIMCFLFIGIYSLLTFTIFNEKSQNYKLQTEYNIMMNSLSEYEKLYSYQRMLNHEFKNDLMVIRGMANKKNHKLLSYIDEITDFKNNKNVTWLNMLKKIPEGGLLGLLYYKLLSMEDNKININFEISDSFKSKDYLIIENNLKNKICKLLGIYLDNAIQAVKNLETRNISITIEEDKQFFTFRISNNFSGNVDICRIFEKGYTTSELGKGYGLAIAKEIFEKEERIINTTKINNDIFIQEIKIKM